MFQPIIHNLSPNDKGYPLIQRYNFLITQKPRGNYPLAEKLALQDAWRLTCNFLLAEIENITKGE